MSSAVESLEARFGKACGMLFDRLAPGEEMSLEFSAEAGEFMRFTNGRVRQVGSVSQSGVRFSYYHDGRTMGSAFEMTGEDHVDRGRAAAALETARREARLLPADPYQVLPTASETSREVFTGKLPDPAAIPAEVLGPAAVVAGAGAEFVGIHSQGAVCRGAANSRGARHWFATETFITDYSAWHANGKALKSSYAGREWDRAEYARRLEAARPRLEVLAHPERIVAPGTYTVYIAPDALNEFVPFFSWNGLGERGMREGESAWRALRDGRRTMSGLFTVHQDFGTGVEPRFNELGEVAPAKLTLVDRGKLAATLVSSRTAKQYGVVSNAAPEDEHARSLCIEPGSLEEAAAVEAIGTGLYISNLHYLNWSDNDSGRITGMTRFACFWVEGGKVAAPIRDMRFDESIYHLFGDKLQALSRERSLVPDTGTYMRRSLGGALLPGLLVRDFTFTL
jgi:predicted Zn-dependent protease